MRRAAFAIVLASVAASGAAPASAELPSFIRGGMVELSYGNIGAYGYSVRSPVGSMAFDLGSGFVAQLDLGYVGYASGSISWNGYQAVHLGYEVAPGTAMGAFYARNFVSGGFSDTMWGIQAVHSLGDGGSLPGLRVEGYLARYESTTVADLALALPVARGLSVLAGYNYSGFLDGYHRMSLGAEYGFDSGLYLRGSVNRIAFSGSGETSVALALGYRFGQGSVFGTRRYFDIHPGL